MRAESPGALFKGDLFTKCACTFPGGGHLFHFNLTENRPKFVVDPRLEDRVAGNKHKVDIIESESLLAGPNFGTVTDIETGPSGNLFVVSLDYGVIHEISRR